MSEKAADEPMNMINRVGSVRAGHSFTGCVGETVKNPFFLSRIPVIEEAA
jgi:hypothetical protein